MRSEALENLEKKALKLFITCHGWKYKSIEQVAESEFYDDDLFLRWAFVARDLENKAKSVALACETEDTIRAWRKAMELKDKIESRLNIGI